MTCLAAVVISGCSSLSLNQARLFRAADIVSELSQEHSQALIVLADDRRPQQARILAWERKGEWWANKFSSIPAVIGRSGFARPGEKREGDGHTPAGAFHLKRAFGYASHMETGLDYQQATLHDFWVDDPASTQYNQWVKGTPQADSYENLKREDKLYQYSVVIEYNTNPVVPGNGSAIFLHVWRNRKTATAGCVAASAKNVKKLLKWLDLSKKPIIILSDEQN